MELTRSMYYRIKPKERFNIGDEIRMFKGNGLLSLLDLHMNHMNDYRNSLKSWDGRTDGIEYEDLTICCSTLLDHC